MIALDSTKLRIPILNNEVSILDLSLQEGWVLVSDLGNLEEVDPDDFKSRAIKHNSNGIKTHFMYCKGAIDKKGMPYDSILVLFNSKVLRSSYLTGITLDNIREVYNRIMEYNVFYCSFEWFMQGFFTDTDIKTDVVLNNGLESQLAIVKHLEAITKASKNRDRGFKSYTSSSNCGIEWTERKKATIAAPYIKIYAKDIELTATKVRGKVNDSAIFSQEYLENIPEGLTRIEATIKNKKHFNNLTGLTIENTLDNLLSLDQRILTNIMKQMAKKHIESQANRDIDKEYNTLSDVFCKAFLYKSDSMALAKHEIAMFCKDKDQRHKARKKIEEIWNAEYSDTDKGKKGQDLDKIFGAIGLGE